MLKSLIPFIPYIIVILGVIWILYRLRPIVLDWIYWNDLDYIKERTIELQRIKAGMDKKSTDYLNQFLKLK